MSGFWHNFFGFFTSLVHELINLPAWLAESLTAQTVCFAILIIVAAFLIDCTFCAINERIKKCSIVRAKQIFDVISIIYAILSVATFCALAYAILKPACKPSIPEFVLILAGIVLGLCARFMLIICCIKLQEHNYQSPRLQYLFHGPAA